MTSSMEVLRLALPCSGRGLGEFLDAQEQALYGAGAEEDLRQRARLVSEEVLSNVLRHADAHEASVEMRLDPASLWLAFADDASNFDPGAFAPVDPSTPLRQRRAGGMGLLLVDQLASRLRYGRVDGRNRIEIVLERMPVDNDDAVPAGLA